MSTAVELVAYGAAWVAVAATFALALVRFAPIMTHQGDATVETLFALAWPVTLPLWLVWRGFRLLTSAVWLAGRSP